MKLNVGSGHCKQWNLENWVNIDCQRVTNSIPMDPVQGLGFRDDTFDQIRVIHVLEHVARNDHQKFLEEILRVLKPQAICFVEVPNLSKVCGLLREADRKGDAVAVQNWTAALYGKHRRPGDGHAWGFTGDSLVTTMEEAGFAGVCLSHMWVSGHHKQGPVFLAKATKLWV